MKLFALLALFPLLADAAPKYTTLTVQGDIAEAIYAKLALPANPTDDEFPSSPAGFIKSGRYFMCYSDLQSVEYSRCTFEQSMPNLPYAFSGLAARELYQALDLKEYEGIDMDRDPTMLTKFGRDFSCSRSPANDYFLCSMKDLKEINHAN